MRRFIKYGQLDKRGNFYTCGPMMSANVGKEKLR